MGEKVRQPHAESMALAAVIQLIVEINGLARGRGQEKTWGMNRVGCGIPLHLLPGLVPPYWVQSKRPGGLEIKEGAMQGGKPAIRIWGEGRENWRCNEKIVLIRKLKKTSSLHIKWTRGAGDKTSLPGHPKP